MARKPKVQVKLDILKKLPKRINSAANQLLVAKVVGAKVEGQIASGISPVTGRKYTSYAADRSEALTDYPYTNKKRSKLLKPVKPVNLNLDGEYLKDFGGFRARFGAGSAAFIGWKKSLSKENAKKFQTHNKGALDHVPMRRVLPNKGEKFNQSIIAATIAIWRKIVSNTIK